MKGTNEAIKAYLNANDNAKKIIDKVVEKKGKIFDAHDFIFALIQSQEGENAYIWWLNAYSKRRFQTVNGLIGKYLSKHESALDIERTAASKTIAIKGYETESQGWKKTI
jgi:hypothetical protein